MKKTRKYLAIAAATTFCMTAAGHTLAVNGPVTVLTAPAEIDYLVQARVGNTRMFAWASGNGPAADKMTGAFVDATDHTLIGAPFELAVPNETFACAAGRTCAITGMFSAAPSIHGDVASGQFLVTWIANVDPDITLNETNMPSNSNAVGRIIRINTDGTPDLQPLFRISYIDNDLNGTLEASDVSIVNGVAFNPTADEYLVTWMGQHQGETEDQPYAVRLDKNGTLVSAGAKIYNGMTASHSTAMTVAYNADAGEYLVTQPSSFSLAGNATLIGGALSPSGAINHAMKNIEPAPVTNGYAGRSALLPLSAERTLVFFEDGDGNRITAMWLDMSTTFGPTAAGRIDVASGGPTNSFSHPEILPMPGQDAAVLVYTDNVSDGDGVKTTGELRYRTIDLAAPTDQLPAMGLARTGTILSGRAVGYFPSTNFRFNLTATDVVDATRFVTFFVDESRPQDVVALEHDLASNELAITKGADQTVTGGDVATLGFTLANHGNSDEIDAFKTLPEANVTLQIVPATGLEITAASGCALQTASLQCVISDPVLVGTDHKVTLSVGTPATETETKSDISVSIISEVDDKDQANNVAVASIVMKSTEINPNDPNDPNDSNDPNDPDEPGDGSSGGGSFGWLGLLALASLRRHRAFIR